MGDKEDGDKFVQGIAYAVGWIIEAHGFESVGLELLKSSGYSYADLLTAHCDKKDLIPIAKALGLRLDGTPRKPTK
jgi:hypothetical protein